jgi:hypothetical protein
VGALASAKPKKELKSAKKKEREKSEATVKPSLRKMKLKLNR